MIDLIIEVPMPSVHCSYIGGHGTHSLVGRLSCSDANTFGIYNC